MAKFAGLVGYVTESETTDGVWTPVSNARMMQGDILRGASVSQNTEKVNKDVTLQHRISVIGDAFAYANFFDIKWVEYLGIKWEVTMIEIIKPRVILTLGGVWNS